MQSIHNLIQDLTNEFAASESDLKRLFDNRLADMRQTAKQNEDMANQAIRSGHDHHRYDFNRVHLEGKIEAYEEIRKILRNNGLMQ